MISLFTSFQQNILPRYVVPRQHTLFMIRFADDTVLISYNNMLMKTVNGSQQLEGKTTTMVQRMEAEHKCGPVTIYDFQSYDFTVGNNFILLRLYGIPWCLSWIFIQRHSQIKKSLEASFSAVSHINKKILQAAENYLLKSHY